MKRNSRLLRHVAKAARIALGILLIIGGLFGFLPILGFWMLPLGAMLLARDIPAVARLIERLRRRFRWTRIHHD